MSARQAFSIAGLAMAGELGLGADIESSMEAFDSATLAALRERIGAREVRVVGALGTTLVPQPVLSDSGIRSPRWDRYRPQRVALIEAPDAPRPAAPPRLIAWSAISEVQVSRPAYGVGVLAGLVAVLGLSISYGQGLAESGITTGQYVAAAAACGTIVGLGVSFAVKDWKPVFPAKP